MNSEINYVARVPRMDGNASTKVAFVRNGTGCGRWRVECGANDVGVCAVYILYIYRDKNKHILMNSAAAAGDGGCGGLAAVVHITWSISGAFVSERTFRVVSVHM